MRKPPTKAESEHMARVASLGCIVTRMNYGAYADADVHHMTSGGRRLGHFCTIPLTPWYHRAAPNIGMTPEHMRSVYGPSLAESRREFEQWFGTELELLEEVNKCLGLSIRPV
jgi:hypothetical protein